MRRLPSVATRKSDYHATTYRLKDTEAESRLPGPSGSVDSGHVSDYRAESDSSAYVGYKVVVCGSMARRAAKTDDGRWRHQGPERAATVGDRFLCSLLDDATDLAAVDLQFSCYGALASPCGVPGAHRPLQGWRVRRQRWRVGFHEWRGLVLRRVRRTLGRRVALCPDESCEEFEGPDECQGGPSADQGAYWSVAEAVRQVSADGGDNASAEAPARQGWYRAVAPVGVEDEHAGCPDQAVDSERHQAGGWA